MPKELFDYAQLSPKPGESANAYNTRINFLKPEAAYEVPLVKVAKIIGYAWEALQISQSPFSAAAMDDPKSSKDFVETAVIIFTQKLKEAFPEIQKAVKNYNEKVGGKVGTEGRIKTTALRDIYSSQLQTTVKRTIEEIKGAMEALKADLQQANDGSLPNIFQINMDDLLTEFREARKTMLNGKDGKKKR